MTDQELENRIRNALQSNTPPDREGFVRILEQLDDSFVTKKEAVRYTIQTATSNITNNKRIEILNIWRSKRFILVPSFLLLLFVGAFSLSMHAQKYDPYIQRLAQQDEALEEENMDEDSQVIVNNFDEPAIDDLSATQNEI